MIDPELHYCRCGETWKPKLPHKIIMLIFGKYDHRCPICNDIMTFELVHHVVKNIWKGDKLWRKP